MAHVLINPSLTAVSMYRIFLTFFAEISAILEVARYMTIAATIQTGSIYREPYYSSFN